MKKSQIEMERMSEAVSHALRGNTKECAITLPGGANMEMSYCLLRRRQWLIGYSRRLVAYVQDSDSRG